MAVACTIKRVCSGPYMVAKGKANLARIVNYDRKVHWKLKHTFTIVTHL